MISYCLAVIRSDDSPLFGCHSERSEESRWNVILTIHKNMQRQDN
jgi:hypothetical protein